MRTLVGLVTAALLLSGCASESEEPVLDAGLDSDGDGYPDVLENKLGSDAHNATSVPDVTVYEPVEFVETVKITVGTDGLGVLGTCGQQGTLDTQVLKWPIAAPANVTDVHVTDLVFKLTMASPTMLDSDMFIFDPTGAAIGESTAFNVMTGQTETLAIEGKHPAGEYVIEVRGCSGSGDVRLEASGSLGYTPPMEELLHDEGVEHQH